jgi:UDP-GlcNAc:undecaprenyl-phosphate GlcNAc-1-phosphate transferase
MLVLDTLLFYALSALVGVSLTMFGVYLARANVYVDEEQPASGDGAPVHRPPTDVSDAHVLYRLFGHRWKAVFGVLADSALLAAAFVVAHYLRFEQGLTTSQEEQMLGALPLLISIKITVFAVAGMYRAIWRHAGTPEIVRTIGASLLASGASIVGLGLGFSWGAFSASIWIIDWMVVTLAVIGIRFGFRGLRQYFLARTTSGPRVVIYGANDAGALLLREVRQNPDLPYNPVGFVDDDPLKKSQRVQGLPVLGTGAKLAAICRFYHIDAVLLAQRAMDANERATAQAATANVDVPCHVFETTLMSAPSTPEVADDEREPNPRLSY